MSTKQDVLDAVNKRAQRLKEIRIKSTISKDVESLVFKFFEEVEAVSTGPNCNTALAYTLIFFAVAQLQEQLKLRFDHGVHVKEVKSTAGHVVGVQITWSSSYALDNQCSNTLYIGVEQMLFG